MLDSLQPGMMTLDGHVVTSSNTYQTFQDHTPQNYGYQESLMAALM